MKTIPTTPPHTPPHTPTTTPTSTATINGIVVSVQQGDTILSAAARAGIDIPTLCHSTRLEAEGGCRMCLVEIGGQRPQAACHTPIAPGMVIQTATPHLTQVRRDLLNLTISALPAGSCKPDPSGSRFEQLLAEYDVSTSDFGHHGTLHAVDDSHPYMRFDRDKCITCRLCLNACEQIQGQFVYGIEGRGGKAHLIFGPTDRFADSDCVSCGACVDQCPTGAITDRDRITPRDIDHATDSVCGYCGVGCRTHIDAADGVVLSIKGVEHATVNHGHLCVKGRYAHAYHHSRDRLTTPLIRNRSGTLQPATWDDAIAYTARRLIEIRDRHGGDALGTMTSSRSTNEAAYLLQKLFRSIIGTNNTDCCARVCHSSTAVALGMVTGTGAATASYPDLEEASLIVVAGANATEAHPVVGARIKQAALRGAALIVVDPRRVELAQYATVHLQLWPGTNVALFNALAKVLIEENLYDKPYVANRCEGFDELRAFLGAQSLDELSRITHVPVQTIRAAAAILASRGPGLFVSGLGLSEQSQGVAGVMAYCNLGLLTGALGKIGSGMLPLRGQNNVQGNADMGSQPYALTGYMKLGDPAVQSRLETIWGKAPPLEAGKTIPEMYDAAVAGTLKALWIQGEDVVQSDPNTDHVTKALSRLDLLIVQELFMTDTAKMAHVVFPAASVLEQEGTFTNGERRIQHVRRAVNAPTHARPDWEVIRDVAIAMKGPNTGWEYHHPSQVMDELARVVPHLFGGVSYDRLGADGVQWPCPTRDHPGTRTLHTDTFVRGKAALMSVDFSPPQDNTDATYPFILITGRVLDHYNVGTMTRRTPSSRIVDKDYLELHPQDAARLGIADGAGVRVKSRWGHTVAPAKLSRRMMPGTTFLSFHFPETQTNCVVGPYVDPTSKCPDYKVIAVDLASA
ncbi:MAG: formate dehydrogenase subunit alpha [Planctomycetes bacterium]|nr:formate dehydrogenase subunit alpha [Planctomycetota bacterium]